MFPTTYFQRISHKGWLLSCAMCLIVCSLFGQELQKIGHLPYAPVRLMGCWHYVDSSGGEWGLIGTNNGLSIVDVRQPTQPVERFNIPLNHDNRHEVRTWAGYAYVGSEAPESGIAIVDLRELPDTVYWKVWRGDGAYENKIKTSHTLQAEAGYLFLFGGSTVTDGVVFADLSDPWNPHVVGIYAANYVHDGYLRGDTLWTSEINKGWVGAVDVSNKSNPVLLTTQPTPGAYSHNSGLSSDGLTLFNTDEKSGAPLSAFDVSNLDDITLLDTYFPSRKPQGEVHNVRVLGDFLINPSYRGQLTIVDASRPANLIETAWDSLGNSLVWDADPYLPSGIILATATLEGLYVYQKPAYQHASWLEGRVFNGTNGQPLSNAKVFVIGTSNADTTGSNGLYRTGAAMPGLYEVFAFRQGFIPATFSGIALQSNQVTALDIQLFPALDVHSPENDPIFKVSPLPFSDELTVQFSDDHAYKLDSATVSLYDGNGKLITEKSVGASKECTFQNLNNLPQGIYWLMTRGPHFSQRRVCVVKQ